MWPGDGRLRRNVSSTPSELGERIVSELARWRKVVNEAKLRVE